MAGTITALEQQKTNPRRVNVSLDGAYAFPLGLDVAVRAGLRTGIPLSDERIAELVAADGWQTLYDATLNFLSYRPRSESEVRRYLARRKAPAAVSEEIIARLKASGLVDDTAFARYWVENRQQFSPRSSRALRSELRSKGVDGATVAAAVSADDSEAAYRAGQKKMRSLAAADAETFRRKLLGFLLRRGFGYEVAQETVARLWREGSAPETRPDLMDET